MKNKSIPQLLKLATKYFNRYIKLRDTNCIGVGYCISSGHPLKYGTEEAQAGHFYSADKYPQLRFNEDNVHLQSRSDNYYKEGNPKKYKIKLIKKIGKERVQALEETAERSKRENFKWDKFELIEIIETYKQKCKELEQTKNF